MSLFPSLPSTLNPFLSAFPAPPPSYTLPSPSNSTLSSLPAPSNAPSTCRISPETSPYHQISKWRKMTCSLTMILPRRHKSVTPSPLTSNSSSRFAQLAQLFESAGTVEMVEVIYDKVTGRSRGFGFVTMSTAAEVEAAAQQFNGCELEGRALRVNAGTPPPKREESFSRGPRSGGYGSERSSYGSERSGSGSSNRVYVGNLSWGVDDTALESLFSEQGKVVEARVIYDRHTGRSKGFGFVTLGSPQEVTRAINSLNGTINIYVCANYCTSSLLSSLKCWKAEKLLHRTPYLQEYQT
ncbi:unnamed protein product [Eruca vesicaria subsp. sativa]|uniref:RRM domain-containing protein n=1 Tax=Eruca vesicaria subsp. sativa TaxID=29727 RepID=A0ABC8KQQ6_ERUVS|nr:unnamed protein product [Eruca vesicaria subsp. sativa]